MSVIVDKKVINGVKVYFKASDNFQNNKTPSELSEMFSNAIDNAVTEIKDAMSKGFKLLYVDSILGGGAWAYGDDPLNISGSRKGD